jgi:hypothetical protein
VYDVCVVYDVEDAHTVEGLAGFINMEGDIYVNCIEDSCMLFKNL